MPKLYSLALGAALASLFWWFWPLPWPWAPDKFLGPDDFIGSTIPGEPVSDGNQSTFSGVLMFNNVDKGLVSDLIPSGFELAPRQTSKLPHQHPVILLFGDQTDGAAVVDGQPVYPIPPINRVHYSEVILLIPFVTKSGSTSGKWHNYVVRMYLDHNLPITGGIFYGYNKVPALINWMGQDAEVSMASGSPLLSGTFKWAGKSYSASAAKTNLTNFGEALGILDTRVLGESVIPGIGICSYWDWNLDKARISRARTSYNIVTPFRQDMASWPALSPFKSDDYSAFVLRGVRWRLGLPVAC